MKLRIEAPEEASPYKLIIKRCYFDLLSLVKVCHITDTACRERREAGMMGEGAKKGCRRLHARLDARATKRRLCNREG